MGKRQRTRYRRPFATARLPSTPRQPRIAKTLLTLRRSRFHHHGLRKGARVACPFLLGQMLNFYLPSACSIAAVTCAESGVTSGSKRETTLPLRSTRNLVKFHLISPEFLGSVALPVRYL